LIKRRAGHSLLPTQKAAVRRGEFQKKFPKMGGEGGTENQGGGEQGRAGGAGAYYYFSCASGQEGWKKKVGKKKRHVTPLTTRRDTGFPFRGRYCIEEKKKKGKKKGRRGGERVFLCSCTNGPHVFLAVVKRGGDHKKGGGTLFELRFLR